MYSITWERNLHMSNSQNKQSFRSKCLSANINYNTAKSYKLRHKKLTDEQVIEYYKNKSISFAEKCRQANIDYNKAKAYRYQHPELTDNQVICLYNPNCYINILGQLVIPQEDGTKIVLD